MDKEKKNGKKKLIITMAVALILLVGVTVSYGYIALVSSSKNQEVSVGTGNIHLELDDADSGSVEANLNLGGSITKTLKITNKGTKPGKVQINWKNLINTYNSRSLSYTLETSSNKISGYTKIEALRENVPVSTEAKEVPLSKEITVPVQSAPIYYRVTITFNDLEDVDQESDLGATLITQFSLTEPESLSKKVIAVLNGNVKTSDPELEYPAPRNVYAEYNYDNPSEVNLLNDLGIDIKSTPYIVYADAYEFNIYSGKFTLKNPKIGEYNEIYSILNNKYTFLEFKNSNNLSEFNLSDRGIVHVTSATLTTINYMDVGVVQAVKEGEYTNSDVNMSSYQNSYITYGDSYTFNTSNGKFKLVNPQICKYSECYQNLIGKYCLRLGESSSVPNNNENAIVRLINSTTLTAMSSSLKMKGGVSIDYSTSGVYAAEDDYGSSYYYRGEVTNNYFKFAGLNWRILRVNGDGSIRIVSYEPNDTPEMTKRTAGYMIGIDETTEDISGSKKEADNNTYDSPLKIALDTWYENNLISYSNYLSDTLFCSDRSVAPSANLWENGDTALGYGNNTTYYGTYYRINQGIPSLKCPLKNDRFTVDDKTIGNGALKYPIATITGDELMMAGVTNISYSSTNKDYLYYTASGHFTMSPSKLTTGSKPKIDNIMRSNTYISLTNRPSAYILAVVNIKPEYALKVIGSGTLADPFMIPGIA